MSVTNVASHDRDIGETPFGFWRRSYAMLVKEFIQLRRDRVSFAMIVMIPVMQLMLFGYALGLAVRSTPLAICILLLWPLVVEGIIAGLLAVANREELQRWLPYQAGFELISGDDSINVISRSLRPSWV